MLVNVLIRYFLLQLCSNVVMKAKTVNVFSRNARTATVVESDSVAKSKRIPPLQGAACVCIVQRLR